MQNGQFWQDRWRNQETPWDQGGAHPLIGPLLELSGHYRSVEVGAKVWEPGCGTGHNGRWLAKKGFKVKSIDLVEEAVKVAQEMGVTPGHEILCQDAFEFDESELSAYDVVFDRAFLCALPPKLRESYVEVCHKRLKPQGLFWGIIFDEVSVEKGPLFQRHSIVPRLVFWEVLLGFLRAFLNRTPVI